MRVPDDYRQTRRTGGTTDVCRVPVEWKPSKDEAACCRARRDALGRLPVGFCSPECVRRP